MNNNSEKPSAEAKALSLFLMAHKSTSNKHKEHAKRINRQWDLVKIGEITKDDYMVEVKSMLDSYGGYHEVVEQTVKFYVKKTGQWKSEGEDQFNIDAKSIADKLLKK